MEERVKDYPDLVKVNRSFVVNTNDSEYQSALLRKKNRETIERLEERVNLLEDKIDQVLSLLIGRYHGHT